MGSSAFVDSPAPDPREHIRKLEAVCAEMRAALQMMEWGQKHPSISRCQFCWATYLGDHSQHNSGCPLSKFLNSDAGKSCVSQEAVERLATELGHEGGDPGLYHTYGGMGRASAKRDAAKRLRALVGK